MTDSNQRVKKKYKVRVGDPSQPAAAARQAPKKQQKLDPSKTPAGTKKRKMEDSIEIDKLPEYKRVRLAQSDLVEMRDVCVVVDRHELVDKAINTLFPGIEQMELSPTLHVADVLFEGNTRQAAIDKSPVQLFGREIRCEAKGWRTNRKADIHLGKNLLFGILQSVFPEAVKLVEFNEEAVRLRFDSNEDAQAAIDGGTHSLYGLSIWPRSLWPIKVRK
jgi:hypothetical protein